MARSTGSTKTLVDDDHLLKGAKALLCMADVSAQGLKLGVRVSPSMVRHDFMEAGLIEFEMIGNTYLTTPGRASAYLEKKRQLKAGRKTWEERLSERIAASA